MYNKGSALMDAETPQPNKMKLKEVSNICDESMGTLRRWAREGRVTFVKALEPTSPSGHWVYTVNREEFYKWWESRNGTVEESETPGPVTPVLTDVEIAILRQILDKLAGQ